KNITVANMISESGDIHHLVPKNYLIKHGYNDRREYNQIANFALTETPINISVKDRAPQDYMAILDKQAATGELRIGEIADTDELAASLDENAVPASIRDTTADSYKEFLDERRVLMAAYI